MEQILHYVWKHKLYNNNLITTDGRCVEILDVGIHNTDQGPDFSNAKIRLGNTIWVGNVEIHKSSDHWYKHNHNNDKLYNSVILHIVEFATQEIKNEANLIVPQCELKYPQHVSDNIDFLLSADIDIPCCNYLRNIPQIHLSSWLNTLLLERLERKTNDIRRLLDRFQYSYTDTFYVLLARSMGFGLNSEAFEQLALSLPLNFILKQADNPIQVEALLFGQAGMLTDNDIEDQYYKRLKLEYEFLRNKYSLSPLNKELFRRLRTRPTSSPYIRIAQLASLLQKIQGLFMKFMETSDLGEIRLCLHVNASEYWQTHYVFGVDSVYKHKYIGDASLDIIIINAVIPLLFSYGSNTNNQIYIEKSLSFLETIKPENNSVIKQFNMYGITSSNAFYTQALIQLKKEYCIKKKCLYCRIGYRLLSEK